MIANGVNYDYILLLSKNSDERLELRKVNINRSMSLINELLSYCDDSNYDVVNMYVAFNKEIRTSKSYDYCLSHDYRDSYIDEVKYPELDISAYRAQEDDYRESLYQEVYKKLKYSHREWSDSEIRDGANQMIEQECAKFVQKMKNKYIEGYLNYIYSHDYNETLSKLDQKSIISFSNEKHGRFSYEHEVNDDLKVRISTNFCYGGASNFRVTVTYKGIEILPYSIWVNYYYAGLIELLHCTRAYYVQRSSWGICMAFVEEFVNNAIDDPDRFVREVVMEEVHGMMSGLRGIYTLGKEYFNRIMEMEPSEESEYVGVRNFRYSNTNDKRYYSVYPNEMYLVYRMGKISGALRFLDNLKQFAEIVEEINSYIQEISSMNISIYPELCDAIPPIKSDIKQLERKLKKEEKELKWLECKFKYLDDKLDRILSKCEYTDRDTRKETFLKANPSYEKLKEQILIKETLVNQMDCDLRKRNEFLSDLQKFKELIEKYVDLPKAA